MTQNYVYIKKYISLMVGDYSWWLNFGITCKTHKCLLKEFLATTQTHMDTLKQAMEHNINSITFPPGEQTHSHTQASSASSTQAYTS